MKKLSLFLLLITINSNNAFAQTKEISASPKQVAASGFADLVEDLLPTVVNISASQDSASNTTVDQALFAELPKAQLFDDFKKQLERQIGSDQKKKKFTSIGSGFLISKDGFIVTNYHVIDDADEITVSIYGGAKYKAKVIGADKKTDLALLKINSDKEFKFAKFGDSSKARIGDWVLVIGNPYGLGGSVSVGIVSARSRDINNGNSEEFIQTDAAINKGNSGGPMFNMKGEVIGISSAIFSPSGGNVGIGFATPSSSAAQIVKQLKDQGEVTRGWIGVSVQEVDDEVADAMKMDRSRGGAFVNEVTNDGPAQRGGLLATDVILKFGDADITEMKILPKTVSNYPIDETARVVVWRKGREKVLRIKVEKMRNEKNKKVEKILEKQQSIKPVGQALGLSLSELKSKVKQGKGETNLEGLAITEINSKSEAADKGMAVGDIIISANQTPVKSIEDFKSAMEESAKSGKKLLLFVKRGDANYSAVLNTK